MQASDLFIFPSVQEGLPVALMEAMAAGLPCACSRIRGNSDLIEDENWMFTYNSVKQCKEIISRYLELQDLSDIGRQNINVMRDFSIETVYKQMKNIYNV